MNTAFVSFNSVCNHTRDKQIGLPLRGCPILLTDRIGLHSVLLPLLIPGLSRSALKTVLLFFFNCTVKVVTNTIHNSTYIHLLTIRHVTEFTFIACMQMLNDYIAYLQYTVLLTCKHHLYDINYLHYVTLDYTIFHYNTLHYLLTYIAYNTLHNLTIRCITYSLYVVIV